MARRPPQTTFRQWLGLAFVLALLAMLLLACTVIRVDSAGRDVTISTETDPAVRIRRQIDPDGNAIAPIPELGGPR